MDFWRSEYEEGNSTSSALAGLQELVDSPNVSRDSIEYSSDDLNSITSDPAESLKSKQTLKATLLAKKRLQAYSTANRFKAGTAKHETSVNEKRQKTSFRKLKKTLYPDDAAKAVIRDIEILKKAGFGGPPIPSSVLSTSVSVPTDIISIEPFIPISLSKLNINKSPTISLNSDLDEENLFKKREIKCRNIRRSATTSRRSASPKNSRRSSKSEKSDSKKEKKEYPLNWTEYKELNLNPQKDALLKSKLFRKPRSKKFSFKRYFSFEVPPPPIEIYKCQPISGDASWIPFPYLRTTSAKPQILYSTNQHVTSPGYLTREQLFSVIPTERKASIEKLWKTASRCQPNNKKITNRKWYPRNWKKFDNTEAKLLEKSVGLSFLQSYSDEGEEEEDILEDINEEFDVAKEVDLDLRENRANTSPSATPKEYPKNFDEETQEDSKDLRTTEVNILNEPPNATDFSVIEKTPPIEEKEEGEVSIEESPREVLEDEYQKTKKELASLEEALKESSISYLENINTIPIEKSDKKSKEKKKSKNSRSEKEHKSKNKKNKSKRKGKKKLRSESEDDEDTSDFEKENLKKKKQKNKKSYLKDKAEKKEKGRKLKKKKAKKKKEAVSNSDSENYEVESDIEENALKKKKKKKKKNSDKSKKDYASEELSGKVQDRKNSLDITHEGYEDDVKFFTARFDKEDDLKNRGKHKKEDFDISRSIQKKNKTNIDLEELTVPSKSETTKGKSKRESSETDDFEKEKYSKQQEEKRKHSKDRNETVKSTEVKEERKKEEIKVDLLKKNEEYLREQDKLRLKQKKYSDNLILNLAKTPESSVKSEDEGSVNSKSRTSEKYKNKDNQSTKSDHSISEPKEKDSDRLIETFKSPETSLNDLEAIKLPEEVLNIKDNKVHRRSDNKTDVKIKHDKHNENKTVIFEMDNNNTKTRKEDHERHHKKDEIKSSTTVVDEKKLKENEDPKVIQKQPDWEKLKNKRKRHISDTVQEKIDQPKQFSKDSEVLKNAELFPLEKDLPPIIHIKKERQSISDTENCEIFDSNEDANRTTENSKQINTSWETDEEVFVVEKSRCPSDVKKSSLNLEIPLNIEHFTRREITVENDAVVEDRELRGELEKIKVKEMDVEFLEAQEKELQQKTQTKSNLKTKRDDEQREPTKEFDVQTPAKKRRWDIKSLDSTISTPKIKAEKSIEIIDVDVNTTHNAITLENEYEEFLKAVTSTKKDNTNKPVVIDSSSDSSVIFSEGHKTKQKFKIGSFFKQEITNLDDLMPKSKETASVLDIPTLQIPLPPMKPAEIQPVPVPLPKLEAVFDLNNPLINLSLSANVTQNITLSLATSVTSISAPVTSSIDISKTSVEISTPVSKDTLVSMNNIPLPVTKSFSSVTSTSPAINSPDIKLHHIPVSTISKSVVTPKMQLFKGETNIPKVSSDEFDIGLESDYSADKEFENTPTKQKIVFATLTLPSKKQLINNSNLNLDDSDNDDQSILEELKRKKLEALIEDNKKEVLIEATNKQVINEEKIIDVAPKAKSPVSNKPISKEDTSRKHSPHKFSSCRRESSPRRKKESPVKRRDSSPKRRSPRRRSPRRSPRRRSPARKRSPHRRRSPGRRSVSPRKRRSISPRKRRSPSPRRKRSPSPKNRQSPRRNRSVSPKSKKISASPRSKSSRHSISHRNRSPKPNERRKSPVPPQISSPFEGLKRSVADSTISDDQLPQSTSRDDYGDNLFNNFQEKEREQDYDSPKRIPLDVRISQVLGYDMPNEASPKPTSSTFTYEELHQQSQYQYTEQYSSIESQVTTPTMRNSSNNQGKRVPQSCYRQVGNMLQIVPNDDIIDIPMPQPPYQAMSSNLTQLTHQTSFEQKPMNMDIKPQILQVGNMLQIVPSEMVPTEMIPVPSEVKIETPEETTMERPFTSTSPERPSSAEAAMLQKIAERRAERENRRQERERRRKEKEKRNKEKEKAKQARMKIKTENMIKASERVNEKALEMEMEGAEADISGESPIQWPPVPIVMAHSVLKEAGKSILLMSGSRKFDLPSEERKTKIVQFADGIKPGEGTSPSAGEELSSPPPPKRKLPKEKRYKKMKFGKKSAKKKVKVKIIKKPSSPLIESDSDDNLPPPSPPPGSPPPHVFPPRIKIKPVNNVPAAYLATIIQTAQQQQHQQQQRQQQQQLQQQHYQANIYCPPINLLMAPPPPPQGIPPHHQSPHGTAVLPAASPHGSQSHFHPSLQPPPPPPVSPHNHYSGSSGQSGHHRHY